MELTDRVLNNLWKLRFAIDTFLLTYYNNDFLTKESFFVEMRRRDIVTYYTDSSFFHVLQTQLEYLYTYANEETFNPDILKYMIFVHHYLTYIMCL